MINYLYVKVRALSYIIILGTILEMNISLDEFT